jgi:hypothetical protein
MRTRRRHLRLQRVQISIRKRRAKQDIQPLKRLGYAAAARAIFHSFPCPLLRKPKFNLAPVVPVLLQLPHNRLR